MPQCELMEPDLLKRSGFFMPESQKLPGRLTGRTPEFESGYSGSNPLPATKMPSQPNPVEALVSEARQCMFESYRGYKKSEKGECEWKTKGEITGRGLGLFAKQSVPALAGMSVGNSFLRTKMESSDQW